MAGILFHARDRLGRCVWTEKTTTSIIKKELRKYDDAFQYLGGI